MEDLSPRTGKTPRSHRVVYGDQTLPSTVYSHFTILTYSSSSRIRSRSRSGLDSVVFVPHALLSSLLVVEEYKLLISVFSVAGVHGRSPDVDFVPNPGLPRKYSNRVRRERSPLPVSVLKNSEMGPELSVGGQGKESTGVFESVVTR